MHVRTTGVRNSHIIIMLTYLQIKHTLHINILSDMVGVTK